MRSNAWYTWAQWKHAAVGFIFRLDDGKVFAIPNHSAVECLKLKTEYRSNKVLVKFTSPSWMGLVLSTNQREIWKNRVKEKWERLKYTNYWNVTRWYTEHASFKGTLIWWFERISCGAFSRSYPIFVFHSLFFFLYINFFSWIWHLSFLYRILFWVENFHHSISNAT